MTPAKNIDRLLEIMAALRTPGTGCPWDLEQSFRTIAPYTIEEAYEVADAIERGDFADLEDELGDLLLQVVYHARMAEEAGYFAFPDVVHAITEKMIRRHPHVFGDQEARAAGAVEGFWERIKAEEKTGKEATAFAPDAEVSGRGTRAPRGEGDGILGGVPVALPALTRAVKLQEKAAKVGFDWPSLVPVFDKLKEELGELEEIALPADPRGTAANVRGHNWAKIEEEFGDLLFVVANVARHLRIDPEAALRGANQKFTRRFRHIEERLAARGSSPAQSTLAEMDALWEEAKAIEQASSRD
jgi:ATP diphosphatase